MAIRPRRILNLTHRKIETLIQDQALGANLAMDLEHTHRVAALSRALTLDLDPRTQVLAPDPVPTLDQTPDHDRDLGQDHPRDHLEDALEVLTVDRIVVVEHAVEAANIDRDLDHRDLDAAVILTAVFSGVVPHSVTLIVGDEVAFPLSGEDPLPLGDVEDFHQDLRFDTEELPPIHPEGGDHLPMAGDTVDPDHLRTLLWVGMHRRRREVSIL